MWRSGILQAAAGSWRLVAIILLSWLSTAVPVPASYTNFEVGQVHPLALTPSGGRLLVVNTPDSLLEIFTVESDGSLTFSSAVPVGLEPVSVGVRSESEAWVVNHLSDSVSIVNLATGVVTRTLATADEPVDVAFAGGRGFVASSREDLVEVFSLADLTAAPTRVELFSREPRALAVSPDGTRLYAVTLKSGNQTTVVNALVIFNNNNPLRQNDRLAQLGLNRMSCSSPPPSYPPLPPGIDRNPTLPDPAPFFDANGVEQAGVPPVALIVRWNEAQNRWEDDAGQNWNDCLPYRLPDQDLFMIDTTTLAVTSVAHLGTSQFDVSVNPADGRIYIPNTDARNFVRFEHPLGVSGHVVDNRMAIVDPSAGNSVTLIDLNGHLDRTAGPTGTAAERAAGLSQPGMMAWRSDGSAAYLVAFGSRQLFRLDGTCLAPACIFGPDRSAPVAVDVGEGPSGVVLHQGHERLYVLNRFSNAIAIVDAVAMTVVGRVALHDPSVAEVRLGRRLLYDAQASGYGDSSCASCHLFGDMDGLAWDLGNPEGDFVPYSDPNDNVRFFATVGGTPVNCDVDVQPNCAGHPGFDPQKGPMTTQTLRRMLEPLHWRFDRPTMLSFNPAFVALMGAPDVGPVEGRPAGLSASDMQLFRQFALGIHFPPNPFRTVMDRPMGDPADSIGMPLPGLPFTGNPRIGEDVFENNPSDAQQPCTSCHFSPFGTVGGQVGGVTPATPTSQAATALFNALPNGSLHNDVGAPHLRNLYEKTGPLFGPPGGPPPDQKSGFGYTHDGSIPDLGTVLTLDIFNLTADQMRHLAAFLHAFPTGVRPSVGQHLTFAPGQPGSPLTDPQEALLQTLMEGEFGFTSSDDIGDLANPQRHCELVATTTMGGVARAFHLSAGVWMQDAAGDPPLTTASLRTSAQTPITFLCTPLGSGLRLGGDRDEDGHLNRDDCAAVDAGAFAAPGPVQDLAVSGGEIATVAWPEQATTTGPGMRYDLVTLAGADLRTTGLGAATCLAGDLSLPSHDDVRALPAPGEVFFYLARARNGCGETGYGVEGGPARPELAPGPCLLP